MSSKVRRIDYFYLMIEDRPGAAVRILATLANAEVYLLAFSVVPTGTSHTQLIVFPEHTELLARAAEKEGFVLTGPQRAFMVSGDDKLGALVDVHVKLAEAEVNVYASSGVTDQRGGYGYVLHVRPDDYEKAANILGV